MKNFMYFESTEGGMNHFVINDVRDLKKLYGWMNDYCKPMDSILLNWMKSADIGEICEHRLGVLVRLKDR